MYNRIICLIFFYIKKIHFSFFTKNYFCYLKSLIFPYNLASYKMISECSNGLISSMFSAIFLKLYKNFSTALDETEALNLHVYLEISKISNFIVPLGSCISAVSPTDFPNKPFPIGEFIEILPDAKSASVSATKV